MDAGLSSLVPGADEPQSGHPAPAVQRRIRCGMPGRSRASSGRKVRLFRQPPALSACSAGHRSGAAGAGAGRRLRAGRYPRAAGTPARAGSPPAAARGAAAVCGKAGRLCAGACIRHGSADAGADGAPPVQLRNKGAGTWHADRRSVHGRAALSCHCADACGLCS